MVAAAFLAFMLQSSVAIDPTGCPGGRHIRLQIVPIASMTASALDTLVSEAATIWRPYGVTITGTQELVRPDDHDNVEWITLIIKDASAPGALASLTFANGAPADVMYASPSMARRMLEGTRLGLRSRAERDVVTARLLGRGVAHEVGHYVLRSRDHSKHGLMRVAFDVRDLAGDQNRFRLEPGQELAVRAQGLSSCSSPLDPLSSPRAATADAQD